MTARLSSTFTLTLPSDREIQLTRLFSAPRKLVYEVMTDPNHVPKWWGPRGLQMVVCDLDFRVGGGYRFVLRAPDGGEHAFRGEYREIVPTERIVSTFEFEGMPGHGSVETMTLSEQEGVTTLSVRSLYKNQQDRDGHLHSGMESGARETHDRLEELIASLGAIGSQILTL